MAGAHIPLTPAVHQMIDVGPVPRFEKCTRAIEFPIVRDMDVFMYERQDGTGLEIGSYAHRSILHDPEEIPSIEAAALSPTEFPFTQADFDPQMVDALDLMPEIVGDESVGVKYAINGLISLTPDGMPILGETPEVKGLWSAAAVWVKEGPGVGKSVAEWMVDGESHIDLHTSDISRFHDHQKTRHHVKARTFEAFPKTYGIIHPAEQWASDRNLRISPMHAREEALGAVFYEAAGWERPQWYEANAPLVERYGVAAREAEWDARWWSPIINAEHLAMREHAGLFDLSAFAIFDVARAWRARRAAGSGARADGRAGRSRRLHAGARARRRLQVRPHDHAARRRGVPHRHRRRARDGRPEALPRPASRRRFGDSCRRHDRLDDDRSLGAARTRHLRERDGRRRLTRGLRVRQPAGRSRSARSSCSHRASPTSATSAGSSTSRSSRVRGCGTRSGRQDSRTGSLPAGSASTGPPDGSRSATGRTARSSRPSTRSSRRGWQRPKVKEQDFVGKEAHLRHRDEEPAAVLCTLTIDDHTSASGVKRYPLGREPITLRDGTPLVDRKGRRSYVTSAGAGPSIGQAHPARVPSARSMRSRARQSSRSST